ncbi:MAG TPA: hypothetical protein VF043_12875 [Ktedonobacteraceae bacterium]
MSVPTYAPPSNYGQQRRMSRGKLWLIIGAATLIVIVGFALIVTIAANSAVNAFFNKTDSPVSVAANYYQSMAHQDYARAYKDLDSNATIKGQHVDQQAFTNLAHEATTQNGLVFGYDIEVQGNDPSHFVVTVKRLGRSYEVHLRLKQEGNDWKIISADGI